MKLTEGSFKLGVVVVTVHSTDGQSNIEDWNPKDAGAAKEYAGETAMCSDVISVDFEDHRRNEKITFKNLAF